MKERKFPPNKWIGKKIRCKGKSLFSIVFSTSIGTHSKARIWFLIMLLSAFNFAMNSICKLNGNAILSHFLHSHRMWGTGFGVGFGMANIATSLSSDCRLLLQKISFRRMLFPFTIILGFTKIVFVVYVIRIKGDEWKKRNYGRGDWRKRLSISLIRLRQIWPDIKYQDNKNNKSN